MKGEILVLTNIKNFIMKKFLKITIVFVLILIMNSYSSIIIATEMDDLQKEQNEVKNEISDQKEKLEQVKEEKKDTLSKVQDLIKEISEYEDDIKELNTKISKLNTEISDAEKQIKEDEEEHERQQTLLNKRLVVMYKNGNKSYLDFFLSSSNIIDFISNYYLISKVTDYDLNLLKELKEHKAKIEKEKEELEDAKQEVAKSKQTLQAKQAGLVTIKKDKEQYAEKLTKEESELNDTLEELLAQEKQVSSRIATLKAQYDAQGGGSSSGTSSYSGGSSSYGFGWPVANHSIGTSYGTRGRYWSLGYHTGIDFPVPSGTPIYSIGDGQVVYKGYSGAYGNHVIIYHGNNIYSLYAHGSSHVVSEGQYVKKGQQILVSGATGNVTGAHLHFEIRTPGSGFYSCVNPRPYLP